MGWLALGAAFEACIRALLGPVGLHFSGVNDALIESV